MLACRNCRINISATTGCAICNPIRKHLVVVGEDEDDRPSLSAVSNEIVSLLKHQLKSIRIALDDDERAAEGEKRLLAAANTLAKVLESARKLQVDGISAVENMSFAERAELFITWITELTPAYRQSLKDKWEKWELETSKPLSQLGSGNEG